MSQGILLCESHVDATEGYRLGDDVTIPLAHTWLGEDATPGEIYRFAVREFGRCTGKVYVDGEAGTQHVGWMFVKVDRYEDTGERFLHETWVTLLDRDETIRHVDYHAIG